MFPVTNHFNNKKYYNPNFNKRGIRQLLYWLWNRQVTPWPSREIKPQKVRNQRVFSEELWVTFINHSTVLIQLDGWNILTDPIWSERASPFSKLGPKRVYSPGIAFDDLPPIDLVFISHNHYDHLDLATLKRLDESHHPKVYIPKGNRALLESIGLKKVEELDWWESVLLSSQHQLFCVPAQHFSGRGLFDRDKTLWAGFVLKGPSGMVYFAGDTGYGPHFKEIREYLGSPMLSLLPIGAFKPEWFMKPIHMSPKDAVQAHIDLASEKSVAIHFGTFQLGDEDLQEAPKELERELIDQMLSSDQFWVLEPGEGRKVK